MSCSLSGPWNLDTIERYLGETAWPLRLSCVGEDGYPRVVSVWFEFREGMLRCVSHRDSGLVRMLGRDGRVGFEVAPNEPPYFGVRGQGDARLDPAAGGAVLPGLLDRYLGGRESTLARWLLSRADEEVLISITPRRFFSWDYRERMGGG